jgi:hypothetical protein
MVKHSCQRRLAKERNPGIYIRLWEKPHRAHIKNDTATKWEDHKLNKDESGNLQKLLTDGTEI